MQPLQGRSALRIAANYLGLPGVPPSTAVAGVCRPRGCLHDRRIDDGLALPVTRHRIAAATQKDFVPLR